MDSMCPKTSMFYYQTYMNLIVHIDAWKLNYYNAIGVINKNVAYPHP